MSSVVTRLAGRSNGSAATSAATSDPIGLSGGLNTYAYVDARPTLLADPSGLCGVDFAKEVVQPAQGGEDFGESVQGTYTSIDISEGSRELQAATLGGMAVLASPAAAAATVETVGLREAVMAAVIAYRILKEAALPVVSPRIPTTRFPQMPPTMRPTAPQPVVPPRSYPAGAPPKP